MDKKQFIVTDDHLALINKMYVGWGGNEFGAPCIDPKRPYGNGDVYDDIGEILGVFPDEIEDGEPKFSDDQRDRMDILHHETKIVLQIILRVGEFRAGLYETPAYKQEWVLVD